MKLKYQAKNKPERIDRFLSKALSSYQDFTRSQIKRFIPEGVFVNGAAVKPAYVLKDGDSIEINESLIQESVAKKRVNIQSDYDVRPERGDLDIVDETVDYLVIRKPVGLIVHPGHNVFNGTLANYLRYYLESKGEYDEGLRNSGISHRLDRPVSGLMVVAKTQQMQKHLWHEFKSGNVKKFYIAKVEMASGDAFLAEKGKSYLVKGYIYRDPENRKVRKVASVEVSINLVSERKRVGEGDVVYRFNGSNRDFPDARTFSNSIEFLGDGVWKVELHTGRQHQIRAMFKGLGYYILGDTLYGKLPTEVESIQLVSAGLEFFDLMGVRRVYTIVPEILSDLGPK